MDMRKWRVGKSYGVHVYSDGQGRSQMQDIPIATFFDPMLAAQAVADHNLAVSMEAQRRREIIRMQQEKESQ